MKRRSGHVFIVVTAALAVGCWLVSRVNHAENPVGTQLDLMLLKSAHPLGSIIIPGADGALGGLEPADSQPMRDQPDRRAPSSPAGATGPQDGHVDNGQAAQPSPRALLENSWMWPGPQAFDSRVLGADALNAALVELRGPVPTAVHPLSFNARKNDILGALLDQASLPPSLGPAMLAMYADPDMDATWRDYVVQHFPMYWDARWPEGSDPTADAFFSDFMATYWQAAEDTEGTIAGTALLGLERLSRTRPEVDVSRVAELALRVALDPDASEFSRISAIQVAARAGAPGALALLRETLGGPSSLMMRISAIAGLGHVGDSQDLYWLQALLDAEPANSPLRPALQSALRQLAARWTS